MIDIILGLTHLTANMSTSLASLPVSTGMADTAQGSGQIVFATLFDLGWKTWSWQLQRFSPTERFRHFSVRIPRWLRLACKRLPAPINRQMFTERSYLARVLNRAIDEMRRRGRISLILASPQRLAPYLLPLCQRENIKLAVSLDTTGPIYTRDLLRAPPRPASAWDEERLIYAAADLLVPWSKWAQESLMNDFGVAASKIALTPPAVDVPPYRPPAQHGNLTRIIFVGNDWQRKGGDRLLQWHQRHFKGLAELHIASSKARARKLPNVVFHGQVPRDHLLTQLLPSMDLFCLPSVHDMSPFAIAEAQAAGLPVISAKLAGIPDLVRDGASGFLLDPLDDQAFISSLRQLIHDQELRHRMSYAAHVHATSFLNAQTVFPRLMHRLKNSLSQPTERLNREQ